jgi:hypothetical protein
MGSASSSPAFTSCSRLLTTQGLRRYRQSIKGIPPRGGLPPLRGGSPVGGSLRAFRPRSRGERSLPVPLLSRPRHRTGCLVHIQSLDDRRRALHVVGGVHRAADIRATPARRGAPAPSSWGKCEFCEPQKGASAVSSSLCDVGSGCGVVDFVRNLHHPSAKRVHAIGGWVHVVFKVGNPLN